jgi:hypothetical protein
MTTLTDAQKQAVRAWLQDGLQLSEIQKRLAAEQGAHLTYMELKLAVSELDVLPKDQERPQPPELPAPPAPPVPPAAGAKAGTAKPPQSAAPPQKQTAPSAAGRVSVTVDQLARPGALASGQVRFSDGKQAAWYFDEMGRLGLVASEPGYRPPAADVAEFQAVLERELARLGF